MAISNKRQVGWTEAPDRTAGLTIALVVGTVLAAGASPAAGATPAAGDPQVERLSKGVSFDQWFWEGEVVLTPAHFESAYTEADLRRAAALGFRNLRLPVQPEVLMNEEQPEQLNPENLPYVDRAIDSALRAGLNVTVDMHPSIATDPATGMKIFDQRLLDPRFLDVFARFWRTLAAHLAAYDPERLFLEPMNEPEYEDPAVWQPIAATLVEAIREGAPSHTIVLDACAWGHYLCLEEMTPLADPNTVYAAHYYDPMTFTHQGAEWVDRATRRVKGLPYPSSPRRVRPVLRRTTDPAARRLVAAYGRERWGRARIRRDVRRIAAWGRRHGRQVIVNEFGVYACFSRRGPRIRWNRDVRQLLEAYGLAWARWDYNKAFGLFRRETCGERPPLDDPDQGMVDALFGNPG